MDFDKPEQLQVQLNNINLREFVDPELLSLLEKNFEDIKVINLTIVVDGEIKDMITIGHPFMDLEEENKIVIDVNEPQSLEKLIEVLKLYRS